MFAERHVVSRQNACCHYIQYVLVCASSKELCIEESVSTCLCARACPFVLYASTVCAHNYFSQHQEKYGKFLFSEGIYVDFPDHLCQFSCKCGHTLPLAQTGYGKLRCTPYILNQSQLPWGESSLDEHHTAEIKLLNMTASVEKSGANRLRRKAVPFRKPKSSPEL